MKNLLFLTAYLLMITTNVFLLCFINQLRKANTRTQEKKPLKIDLRASKKTDKNQMTADEKRRQAILENINNYGTNNPQKVIK